MRRTSKYSIPTFGFPPTHPVVTFAVPDSESFVDIVHTYSHLQIFQQNHCFSQAIENLPDVVSFSVIMWHNIISMIWGHHWIENSRKWGGFWGSQGPAIGSQASFKILSGTAVKPHLTRKSEEFLQCRSKFWNLLGNLSQALETPRTPPIFDYLTYIQMIWSFVSM